MLARCILGADFDIEEIENYTEAYGTEIDPETEQIDTKVKFNDAVRRYSRERIYKPTTTDRVEEKWFHSNDRQITSSNWSLSE